jgi:pimeloyl-ACP methyl ester carboxylesterase
VGVSEIFTFDCAAPEPHRIAFYRWGNPSSKETVLCAHGLTRNGRDFDFLAEALAKDGFQVIAADMPGRGKSGRLKDAAHYNNQTYVDDVKALLDHLHLKKVHWIGTSMGGIMAMMVEAQHPGAIESLVLNDVGCVLPLAGLAAIATYLRSPKPSDKESLQRWMVDNWREFHMPGGYDDRYWQHLFSHYVRQNANGGWELACDPVISAVFGKAIEHATEDVDFSPFCMMLADIPTLLVRGTKSQLLTESVAQKTRALWNPHTPFEEYVVADTGHAPMLMRDEEITKIRDWLAKRKAA